MIPFLNLTSVSLGGGAARPSSRGRAFGIGRVTRFLAKLNSRRTRRGGYCTPLARVWASLSFRFLFPRPGWGGRAASVLTWNHDLTPRFPVNPAPRSFFPRKEPGTGSWMFLQKETKGTKGERSDRADARCYV